MTTTHTRAESLLTAWIIIFSGVLVAAEPAAPATNAVSISRKKIAILANVWNDKCHAHAIATKFFTGFPTDEGVAEPEVDVAAIWVDQPSDQDVAHRLAAHANIPIYPTVAQALCLGGTNLAVDGVLYIGEHGDYPRSRMGVKMYPRLRVLEQVFQVFDSAGRSVPVFNDKHLAYSWLDSKWIYDRATELRAPMLAGSVIPLSWRRPALEHPAGAAITRGGARAGDELWISGQPGRAALGLGWGGIKPGPNWTMKRDMLSPRATTHWDELVLVH